MHKIDKNKLQTPSRKICSDTDYPKGLCTVPWQTFPPRLHAKHLYNWSEFSFLCLFMWKTPQLLDFQMSAFQPEIRTDSFEEHIDRSREEVRARFWADIVGGTSHRCLCLFVFSLFSFDDVKRT